MKTMKNILLIMLAGVAMMMSSCSKDSPVDPVAPVNPPAPADRWEDILTCQVEEVIQDDGYGGSAIRINLIVSGDECYYVPNPPTVWIKAKGELVYFMGSDYKPCTERTYDRWKNGDGKNPQTLARYTTVVIISKVGTFDFVLEVPAENPAASKSYRTKLLRLKIDKSPAGEWSAEFLPADGQ